jgi:integrase
MFVFSCFTGLAYADMRELSERHLHKTSDGNIWIEIPRYKTEVVSNIRLLDIPVSIIEKYRLARKSEHIFNMVSNSFISKNMRIIEKLCDIEHLHFHMARHTFATLICLTNDVSFESLGKMMGHKSMRSTQIDGEITHQKVSKDMKKWRC